MTRQAAGETRLPTGCQPVAPVPVYSITVVLQTLKLKRGMKPL